MRQDWVDTVWDGQFTETLELPADYEEIIQGVELDKLLTRLTELISRWIKTHKNGAEEVEDSADMNSTSQSVDLYRSLFHQLQSYELKIKFSWDTVPLNGQSAFCIRLNDKKGFIISPSF